MNEITLREVCNGFGVSRHAVQGYEKAGLVSATGKNKRGHLLYDDNSQERIRKIKIFQEMGFSIKEICGIIDAPNHIIKKALEDRIEKLKEDSVHTELMIQRAHDMLKVL